MGLMGFFEKRRIPKYNDPKQIQSGRISVDSVLCSGCKFCVKACPAGAIEMDDKKAIVLADNECIFCGDCSAICLEQAITLIAPYRYQGFYKTLSYGKPEKPRLEFQQHVKSGSLPQVEPK